MPMVANSANLRPVEPGLNPVRPAPGLMLSAGLAVRRILVSDDYPGRKTPGAARAFLRRLCRECEPRGLAMRKGGRWWVSPQAHPALSVPPNLKRKADTLAGLPEGRRNRAVAKARAVADLEGYRRRNRLGMVEARRRFVEEFREHYTYADGDRRRTLILKPGTLATWQKLHDAGGLDALAADGRGKYGRQQPDAEAIEFYLAHRYDPRKFTVAMCHRLTADEAARQKWRWFSTLSACRAWDRQTRDDRALTLNRDGDQAYKRRCQRWIEPDPKSFAPGQCIEMDDTPCNVWVEYRGRVFRPTLSLSIDWRSRLIYGWAILPSGTEQGVLAAFRNGERTHGYIPDVVIADNGKNFSAWSWTGGRPKRRIYRQAGELAESFEGLYALLGIQTKWSLPYNPDGKPRVERFFRTVDEQFFRLWPSYCGNRPENRPEAHSDLVAKAVPFDEFVPAFGQWVEAYQNRPHGGEHMYGLSPRQMLAQAPRKRVLDESLRPFLLQTWHRPISVGQNGVAIRVAGTTIRYGAADPAILALAIGEKVRVGYDPADIARVTVWTMDYRFIATVEANQKFNRALPSEALREEMRAIAREKRAHREARKAGQEHLRDPVQRAIAALNRDAAKRRLPDPPGPDGGPVLVPVQSPITPPRPDQVRRVAVGAEGLDLYQRFQQAAAKAPTAGRKLPSASALLSRLAGRADR